MQKLQQAQIEGTQFPYNTYFQDTYKSIYGPKEEAFHVFLQGIGGSSLWSKDNKPVVSIAELGFGTATNFIITAHHFLHTSLDNQCLFYAAIEGYPLSKKQMQQYCPAFDSLSQSIKDQLLNYYPSSILGCYVIPFFNHRIVLLLYFGDIDYWMPRITGKMDGWYLDGFSPKTCPKMWSDQVFSFVAKHSVYHAKVSTFSVATTVQKKLTDNGFIIKKRTHSSVHIKKKETLTAIYMNGHKRTYPSEVHIYGAGIAGTSLGYLFKGRAKVFDCTKPMTQASGVRHAVVAPKFLRDTTGKTEFFQTAYYYSQAYYEQWPNVIVKKGLIDLPLSPMEQKRMAYFKQTQQIPQEDLQFHNLLNIRTLSNVNISNKSSIYAVYPKGIILDTKKLLSHLLGYFTVEQKYFSSQELEKIQEYPTKSSTSTNLCSTNLCSTILCLGQNLPSPFIIPNHGQTLSIPTSHIRHLPKMSVQGAGYMIAPIEGMITLGGSFQKSTGQSTGQSNDDPSNDGSQTEKKIYPPYEMIRHISKILPDLFYSLRIQDIWTGTRATTKTRFPVLYPWDISHLIGQRSHGDLWIYGGLGSHGFQSAPLLSLHLFAQFHQLPSPIMQQTQSLLMPTVM